MITRFTLDWVIAVLIFAPPTLPPTRVSKATPAVKAVNVIPFALPPTLTIAVPPLIEVRNAAPIVLVVSVPVAE